MDFVMKAAPTVSFLFFLWNLYDYMMACEQFVVQPEYKDHFKEIIQNGFLLTVFFYRDRDE